MSSRPERSEVEGPAASSIKIQPEHSAPIHGTQSFVGTLGVCLRRPSLLGIELAWRWGLGIPALALIYYEGSKILASVSLAHTGIDQFSLIDSVTAAQIISAVMDVLLPPVRQVAIWLVPLLAVAWAIVSGIGRSAVLRRYDPTLRRAPGLLVGMQFLRIVMLGGSLFVWFVCLRWAAWSSLGGAQPNLVGYFAKAIVLSMAVFCFWAAVSWVFSVAPLIALLENKGMLASLSAAMHFGSGSLRGLRSKLIEINLVLGIVKVVLILLAMFFSVTPLPFKAQIHGLSLYLWWACVTVWYMIATDFFQVARLIAFIELWRARNV